MTKFREDRSTTSKLEDFLSMPRNCSEFQNLTVGVYSFTSFYMYKSSYNTWIFLLQPKFHVHFQNYNFGNLVFDFSNRLHKSAKHRTRNTRRHASLIFEDFPNISFISFSNTQQLYTISTFTYIRLNEVWD